MTNDPQQDLKYESSMKLPGRDKTETLSNILYVLDLTHCGLVMRYGIMELSQHWFS